MGLTFPYKLESFSLEVGGPSYGQNKNIWFGENLIESPHKTLLTFFTQIVPHYRSQPKQQHNQQKQKQKREL